MKSMLEEAMITDLKIELDEECAARHIPKSGVKKLVDHYMGFNEWSEERALKYALKLIRNGTIKELQRIFGGRKIMNEYKIIEVKANDTNTFNYLYNTWAMTWEGLREEDFPKALKEFEEEAPGQIMIGYRILGKDMNKHYKLTGDNAYPDDLNIFAVTDYGYSIAINYGARWFPDIVDNNKRREEEKKVR